MVFPFKQALENKNGAITIDTKEYNGTHFAKDYYSTKLYTEIKIGNPIQKVKVLLAGELCAFKIGKSTNCIYIDKYLSYYNRNKSNDFTYTPKCSMTDMEFNDELGSTAEDTLYAYTDTKLEKEEVFKSVGFFLGSDTNEQLCGIIGLENDNIICDRIYNIVKDCKEKEYINNNKYILKYNNSINDGVFIIGAEFKDVIDNYNENYTFSLQLTNRVRTYMFGVEINKAKLGEENDTIDTNIPGQFNNDFSFIIAGPKYLEYFSKLFFKKYFDKKICRTNSYNHDPKLVFSEKYNVIECDKDKFKENDLQKLPKFYLYLGEYFEEKKLFFDYKDLFTETKYKYFFNIIFDNTTRSRIDLGKIFLKKYLVNFNFDGKVIEIYDPYIPNEKNKNEKDYTVLYIIIIIFLFIITGVVGYFLGKYLNKMRKKRANELNDDYEYKAETENLPGAVINS